MKNVIKRANIFFYSFINTCIFFPVTKERNEEEKNFLDAFSQMQKDLKKKNNNNNLIVKTLLKFFSKFLKKVFHVLFHLKVKRYDI